MIRILQVIASMNAGGMESMIMNYYRKMDRNEIQFDFLLFTKQKVFYEDEILSLGGKIYKVTPRRENLIKNKQEVKQFFKQNHYDIAEFHQGITYFYPLKMAKKYNVQTRIIHNHGIDRNFLKKFKLYNEIYAKNRISNLATNYFTCSNEVNNQLFSKSVIKNKKIEIVENAIDVEKYKFNQFDKTKLREELKIDRDVLVYGHIGTFTYPKNHDFLIKIFKKIIEKQPNSVLLLIGEGPLKDCIQKQVKDENLLHQVKFLGVRKDVEKILSLMDCLLFPSLFEGIPLTLIEAQANGIPIIMSDRISKHTVVNDNCIQVSLENPDKWIDKSLKVVMQNQEETRMQKNEDMRKTNFDIDKAVEKLKNIYNSY